MKDPVGMRENESFEGRRKKYNRIRKDQREMRQAFFVKWIKEGKSKSHVYSLFMKTGMTGKNQTQIRSQYNYYKDMIDRGLL